VKKTDKCPMGFSHGEKWFSKTTQNGFR
jgi:hypothetical protein